MIYNITIALCRYACIDDNISVEEMWEATRIETGQYNIIIIFMIHFQKSLAAVEFFRRIRRYHGGK